MKIAKVALAFLVATVVVAVTVRILLGVVYDRARIFSIPIDLDDSAISRIVEEKTWDCSGKEARYRQIKFFLKKEVEGLTENNFGSAALVTKGPEGLVNRTDAIIGDPENKEIKIFVASQNCEQKFAQTVNEETQELTCEVFAEYECEKPVVNLEGEAILTIRP
ncbi:MAG: hypothetical protein U0944_03130 [Candidatus Moranbacteria bacterium]|nr:hypothetical protein [Candidatus Moranbacteria bacterium]